MSNGKISVIVPVYNVERYISRAMDSLIKQTFGNIEILVVNDCSLDGSMEIVKKYGQQDNRIQIINHDVNKGLGEARNTGIKAASGEYLFFLDSDDWIEERTLETLYQTAIKEKADIVECGSRLVFEDGSSQNFLSNSIRVKDKFDAISLISEHKIGFMAWDKLYETDLIKKNSFYFPPILHEDINFAIQCVYYASKIVVIPDHLYNYFQRQESISNTNINPKHLGSYFTVINNANKFFEEINLYEKSPHSVQKLQKSLSNWLLEKLLRFYSSEGNNEDKNKQLMDAMYVHFGSSSFFVQSMLSLLLENIIYQNSLGSRSGIKRKLSSLLKRLGT
ncbi:glycosyltransferase family 2 protein [Paenibacillus validus]|uniref:Glycosyltransferase n=1 Tax=Paenibacillus validus TaxID=44253 RepID=A0A7X2ZFG0_9BACL|nr:glycosyltransferase [Paenibacillus validus]MUG73948.1 glycosyltransferase [Paenibacillus validus]